MTRILFVDDDLRFLEALRVGLLPRADTWSMTFVDSGARALEELDRSPQDLLVADVRMPGMDGAQLLRSVRDRWPDTVRIVLSGAADLGDVVRLLPVAHQYLSKPCVAKRIEEVIERSLDLKAMLSKSVLRALLGSTDRLPAQPRVFARLQVAMANEKISTRDVSRIIRADAMVTAKVLQIVNSAFFRPAKRVTSIEQAVTYLGFPAVRNLAMCAEVFAHRPSTGSVVPLSLERLQQHSNRVAAVVHALTAETTWWNEDAVLSALLHDIGYWLLVQERPRDLEKALEVAIAERIPMYEAETRVLGASHAEVGAYLLGLWGLPYPIVEAVARHHTPEVVRAGKFDVLAALAVAMALSGTDDSDVFLKTTPRSNVVGEEYLASRDAPFTWRQAEERAVACLRRIDRDGQ